MQIEEKQNYIPSELHLKQKSSQDQHKSPSPKPIPERKQITSLRQSEESTEFISGEDSQVCAKVFQWFNQKKIVRGNPQEIIEKFTSKSHERIRQLSGNGPFLPRLNILESKLIRKRFEKIVG